MLNTCMCSGVDGMSLLIGEYYGDLRQSFGHSHCANM